MKKLIIFTSTRADYGLLRNLIEKLTSNEKFNVRLLVTGTHLSEKYGDTIEEIYSDGYRNKVDEILISNIDQKNSSEVIGICIQKYSIYLKAKNYNLAIILGDRFEAFAMASACFLNNIDIAHIHGGETTEGAIDNKLRHCITLMSKFHFTSHKKHLSKVQKLLGSKKNTFISGPMILDAIGNIELLSKKNFKKELNYEFNKYNFLITYHPVTKAKDYGFREFSNLLSVLNDLLILEKLPINILFTYPNCDDGNKQIIEGIKNFNSINNSNSFIYKSLGQKKYLSALNLFDLVIGNSSSGIIEAGFFDIKVLNIGLRQKGRTRFGEVFESNGRIINIKKSITQILLKLGKKDNYTKKIKSHNSPSNIIFNALL